MPLTNDNGQGPIILSQEPVAGNVHINIQDPNKPKTPPKYVNKLPPKETVGTKLKHAFLGPEVDKVGEYVVKEYLRRSVTVSRFSYLVRSFLRKAAVWIIRVSIIRILLRDSNRLLKHINCWMPLTHLLSGPMQMHKPL